MARTTQERAFAGDLKSLQYTVGKEGSQILHCLDSGGRSLLHWAVDGNQMQTAQYLLENGVSLHTTDKNGATPLDYIELLYSDIITSPWLSTEVKKQREAETNLLTTWRDFLFSHEAVHGSRNVYEHPTSNMILPEIKESKSKRDSSRFWSNQPVPFTGKKTSKSIPSMLPYGVIWAPLVAPTCSEENLVEELIDQVHQLIMSEVDDALCWIGGIEFHPSLSLITKVLKRADCWEGLQEEESGRLVGFVAATTFEYSLHGIKHTCMEAHSLVLDVKYRGQHVTPLLIAKLQKAGIHFNVTQGMFTTTSNLPIQRLCTTNSYFRVLRPKVVRKTPFFSRDSEQSMAHYCATLKPELPEISFTCVPYKDCHKSEALEVVSHYLETFSLHRVFSSVEDFHTLVEKTLDTEFAFVLLNAEKKIIGFFRFLLLLAQISHISHTDYAVAAQVSYVAISNEKDLTMSTLLSHVFCEAYRAGADLVFLQDVMIKKFDSIQRQFNVQAMNKVQYHLFNHPHQTLPPSELGITFW